MTPATVPPVHDTISTRPAPISRSRSTRPLRCASAHDSSTASCASASRRTGPPRNDGATDIPIARYRRFSISAAAMAAAIAPPEPSTEATANCADPANVVSDIRIGGATPMPASRARMPNDAPNANTAIASGAVARMAATISADTRGGFAAVGWRDRSDSGVHAVASNVRALRLDAGLTLSDLAGAAGLGKSTLAQLESGKANPSVETLWAIAAALKVPFARLVEEER